MRMASRTRWVLGAVLAVSLVTGTAVAAVLPAPTAAPPAHRVADDPACGGRGFDRVVAESDPGLSWCVHQAEDSYAATKTASGSPKGNAVGVQPRCYGDGQSGPRIQMIYGYVQGDPNRAKVAVPQIRDIVATRMEAMVRAASAGKDLGIRFAMTPGCKAVDVKVIAFPRSVLYNSKPGNDGVQYGGIGAYLVKLGMNRTDRKYNVMWDGWVSGGTCGLGALLGVDTPQPANPNNGVPTVGARTDAAGQARDAANTAVGLTPNVAGRPSRVDYLIPQLDVVWNHVFGKQGPSCWGTGPKEWPIAALHEMFHSLGAVQTSAPHSDGGAHCLDVPSVMCYGKNVVYFPQCDNKPVPVLDCGQDDYWNPNPPAGADDRSYLFTHNNVAQSPFIGPEPQDQLVASPY